MGFEGLAAWIGQQAMSILVIVGMVVLIKSFKDQSWSKLITTIAFGSIVIIFIQQPQIFVNIVQFVLTKLNIG